MVKEILKSDLTEKEMKYLERLKRKYPNVGCPVGSSILIFSCLAVVAHAIERSPLPGWMAFVLLYFPTLFGFSYLRRHAIFKFRLMCKLGMRYDGDGSLSVSNRELEG